MAQFDFAVVTTGEFRDWLVTGFLLSLRLTAITWILSLPIATATALCRLSSVTALRWVGAVFVESIRNVPLLVHLLLWYFAMPELLPDTARNWLYEHDAEAVCAVIALTLYTSSYMAEDIRSGIRTVPATQLEAARALGFGFLTSMRRIVLPQAFRIVVPPLISQALNLWKNTSIATVIGTAELMYQAQRVETASFRGVETFGVTTIAYVSVSLAITALAGWLQHRFPMRAS
ncbi:MAG: transporter permease [Gammaproteobacteria bacterium]|nr:transporter permease [Gammaproteobacteria bacterium]